VVSAGVAIISGVVVWKTIDLIKEKSEPENKDKQRVVIIGSGFGAMGFLNTINTKKFDVTVISPRSYFLYTPLLPDALGGLVDFQSIIEPIRYFGKRTGKKFRYVEGKCTNVDIEKNKVIVKPVQELDKNVPPFDVEYDYLIVAVGGYMDDKTVPGVTDHCNFFNSINDAKRLRNRIVDRVEQAQYPGVSTEEKEKLLHFVVVGGGPAAGKTATMIKDFVVDKLKTIQGAELLDLSKVSLIKSDDHIHNYYDYVISHRYAKTIKKESLNILKDDVVSVTKDNITLKKEDGTTETLPYGACVWLTGKHRQPLADKIASQIKTQDNQLALIVDPALKLLGSDNIYAVGDCATLDQKSLILKWDRLFQEADLNQDNFVDKEEFKKLCEELGKKYPSLLEIRRRTDELFSQGDKNSDNRLEAEEFRRLLMIMDKSLTRFPTTASTAVQQGGFLGEHFNNGHHQNEQTKNYFRYKHIGGYEYIGAEDGLVERGSKGSAIISGWGADWMWNNVYYSSLVGIPIRLRVASNRLCALLFGRDLGRL